MTIRRIILVIVIALNTVSAWCAKAYPGAVTIIQRDGFPLTIIQHGDENFNYVTTTDGVLLYQEGNDYYLANTGADGSLSPTPLLAHNAGQRTREEIKFIARQNRKAFQAYAIHEHRRMSAARREPIITEGTTLFPHTGSPKVMVFLADFIDQRFANDDATTLQYFTTYLTYKFTGSGNKIPGNNTNNYGSVYRYFSDMSSKQFEPVFEIKGIIHLYDSLKYYGAGRYDYMSRFVPNVCKLAHDSLGVDFSGYDSNDDGNVDLVYIIYAGYGQHYTGNSTDCIWPKSGVVSGGTYDGKSVVRFGVHNELNYSPSKTASQYNNVPQINGIGLFCHEFSHAMGFPDIYPTTKAAQDAGNPAMEYWDVMDGGEYTYNSGYMPTAYTAWEREAVGWITIDTLTNEHMGKRITLKSIDAGGKAYRILKDDDQPSNEYAIIENIQSLKWNQVLAQAYGHGMLVTHVDYDRNDFTTSNVNNTIGHSRMTLFAADGLVMSSYTRPSDEAYIASHHGDPYPGELNVTDIESFPVYTGTMTKAFLDIEESGTDISFYYLVRPIPQDDEYHIDTEAYQQWPLSSLATTTITPSLQTGTDENGYDILYSPDLDELTYTFDDLDLQAIEGLHMNLNPKEDAGIDVVLEVAVSGQEEPVQLTKHYDLTRRVWNTVRIPLDTQSLKEAIQEQLADNGENGEDVTEGEEEETGEGGEEPGEEGGETPDDEGGETPGDEGGDEPGTGGDDPEEGGDEPGDVEEIEIENIVSITIRPSEQAAIFFEAPSFYGNEQGISTTINIPVANKSDNSYYDLAGRRMSYKDLPHGVYIRNGKKYVKH